jgi:hypothetical protein
VGVYFREPQASCENYSRPRLANAAVWAEGEGEMTGLRPASRPWTLTDDDMLRKLLASGMKQRLIAQKMKRSIGTIESRMFFLKSPGGGLRLGHPRPRITEGDSASRPDRLRAVFLFSGSDTVQTDQKLWLYSRANRPLAVKNVGSNFTSKRDFDSHPPACRAGTERKT